MKAQLAISGVSNLILQTLTKRILPMFEDFGPSKLVCPHGHGKAPLAQDAEEYQKTAFPPVPRSHPILCISIDGESVLGLDGQIFQLCAGDMAFVPANVPHFETFYDGPRRFYQSMWVHLKPHGTEAMMFHYDSQEVPSFRVVATSFLEPLPDVARLAERAEQECRLQMPLFETVVRAHAQELIVILIRALRTAVHAQSRETAEEARRRIISQVVAYLHNFYHHPLSLEEIAQVAGLSPNYFCEVFKQHVGQTVISYLNDLRIDAARQMLRTTDKPIAQIARAVGFRSVYYFSRLFKRLCGISPSAYRHSSS